MVHATCNGEALRYNSRATLLNPECMACGDAGLLAALAAQQVIAGQRGLRWRVSLSA